VALNYIFGVGPTLSKKILAKAKIDENTSETKNLTPEQEDKLRMIIEKEYKTEGDLKREIMANIKRLKTSSATEAQTYETSSRPADKEPKQIPAR